VDELGFIDRINVEGRFSIADKFPMSKSRCGVYLLEFADGLFYIGKAVNVVRRFAQHRKLYTNICYLRFQPVKQKDLDSVEQDLIHHGEASGLALTNKIHVSQVQGETDIDFLITPKEQSAWLADASVFADDTERVKIELEDKYRIRQKYQFQRFEKSLHFENIIPILKLYVSESIIAPKQTEFSFWSISCMPSTNASTWPRLTAINLNRMEVCVIGYYKQDPECIWSFVNIAQDCFFDHYTEEAFCSKYPNTTIDSVGYVAAGYDQISIRMEGTDALYDVLQDGIVLAAASTLNLRLMQKGGNFYANSHCFELADLLV
jgi:hypothetical protein